MDTFPILHFFAGRTVWPLSLKRMDGFDMLFTCHWHDDYFEKCCVSRSVRIYVIAGVFTYLAEVLLFDLHFAIHSIMACPSSVPAVSQQVHLSTANQIIQSWNVHQQTQDDLLAIGIARHKPLRSKSPCPVHPGTATRSA